MLGARRWWVVAEGILALEGGKDGLCRGCGAKLRWWVTFPKRKPMPFEGDPVILEDTGCKEEGVRVLRVSTAHVHWAKCPKAGKFRNRRDQTGV